jgi:hypothetical protein
MGGPGDDRRSTGLFMSLAALPLLLLLFCSPAAAECIKSAFISSPDTVISDGYDGLYAADIECMLVGYRGPRGQQGHADLHKLGRRFMQHKWILHLRLHSGHGRTWRRA